MHNICVVLLVSALLALFALQACPAPAMASTSGDALQQVLKEAQDLFPWLQHHRRYA